MTVKELAAALRLEILVSGNQENRISGGYTGDLLSWVMGRARPGDALITVMGNVNAVAVAALAEISCIILAESSPLAAQAKQKAAERGIPVLRSEKNAYELSVMLSGALS